MINIRRQNLINLIGKYPTQQAFADTIGVTNGYVSQLVRGHREIGEKIARKIEAILGLPDLFLDIESNLGYNNANGSFQETIKLGRFTRVPVIGMIRPNGNVWEGLEMNSQGSGFINYPTKDVKAYAIRCTGDALKPRIKDGEYVIIEPEMPVLSGDEVAILSLEGKYIMQTFEYIRENKLYYTSINEDTLKESMELSLIEGYYLIAAIVKAINFYPAT